MATHAKIAHEQHDLRLLNERDLPAARALCDVDLTASILAATRVADADKYGIRSAGGQLWGYPARGSLRAVVWVGTNVVPINPHNEPGFASAVAGTLALRNRAISSIVGPAEDVLGIWKALEPHWVAAREVRPRQFSMRIDTEPQIDIDPRVRLSIADDFSALLPACVKMFTEEVGYSPLDAAPNGYPQRVRWLIETGCSWIVPAPEPTEQVPVQFKAEVGAQSESLAQVQGVWVPPGLRGQGIAPAAMAAVVQLLRERGQSASLYVNDYNDAAIATYRKVGFRQVGTYATVLF